jgi:hypothetical protein
MTRQLYVRDDFGVLQLLNKEEAAAAFRDFWESYGIDPHLPRSPRQDAPHTCPQCGCQTLPVQ